MNKSLQRHLSLMLGGTILCVGLAAAAGSFALAYSEAQELQDDVLRQIANLDAGSGPGSTGRQSVADNAASDPESRISIIHLPDEIRPDWLPADLAPGFHSMGVGTTLFRIFARDTSTGKRTVVAQPTGVRDEIALNSALRTLIPLLLLLPVLVFLTVRIIRGEFAPVARLSKSLDDQPADRPQSIAAAGLPAEIVPFVNAINRLLERVKHLMEQQKCFIADAAHELRSPLTALSVQAQNLRHAGSLETARDRVVPLQAGIERARLLTEQLLNMARTQSDHVRITTVNISTLARELIAEFLPMAAAKRIDLGLDESAPMSTRTSREVLRLILRNALENAIKYTPDRGEVTLRLHCDNAHIVIEVVDDGPGIPALEREQVFSAFYRMRESAGEGSGLGLAIAREAAIRLGGVLSLHDRDGGRGLVFRYRNRHQP